MWQFFRPQEFEFPEAGWKIHVSLSLLEFDQSLDQILRSLVSLRVAFKLPTTIEAAAYINSGGIGNSQIGKVVTVYPPNDQTTVATVNALQKVTPIGNGPRVPSDLVVEGGGGIHIRFGAFSTQQVRVDAFGRYIPLVRNSDGGYQEDLRNLEGSSLTASKSVPDGIAVRAADYAGMDQSVMKLGLIQKNDKGCVYIGTTLGSFETCIIKESNRGVLCDINGHDAISRLKNELSILNVLSKSGYPAPKVISSAEARDSFALAISDAGGIPVDQLEIQERCAALPSLARALLDLHEIGIVHRDIKLSNVVLSDSGDVTLVDFELAARVGETRPILGGTRNYYRPGRVAQAVSLQEDYFAFAVAVAHAYLGIDPALLPENPARLIGLLNLFGKYEQASQVCSLMFGAADEAGSILRGMSLPAASKTPDNPLTERGQLETRLNGTKLKHWSARASMESYVATEDFVLPSSNGSAWANLHFQADFLCESINLGAAGILIAKRVVESVFRIPQTVNSDRKIIDWLVSSEPPPESCGLFTGNAGVALALAVCSLATGDSYMLQAARARLELAAQNVREMDLFSGRAGVVLAGQLIDHLTRDRWGSEIVRPLVEDLLGSAVTVDGLIVWPNSGQLDTAQEPFLGAAHGASGIAMVLARWGGAYSNGTCRELAISTFRSLYKSGRCEGNESLLYSLDDPTRGTASGDWCHGAAGYLKCILESFGDSPELREEIDWALHMFLDHVRSYKASNVTYCHGLAGRLELLRMISSFRRLAPAVVGLDVLTVKSLRFLTRRVQGKLVWSSEDNLVFTPDLWVGFMAPAVELALWRAGVSEPLLSPAVLKQAAQS